MTYPEYQRRDQELVRMIQQERLAHEEHIASLEAEREALREQYKLQSREQKRGAA